MISYKHYIKMWISFTLLFVIATFGLELLEGYKITTTEYYGLRNIGMIFMFLIAFFAFAIYLITFLPLTIIIHKLVNPFILRVIIFSFIGGICGMWVFENLYGFADGYFINGYDLEKKSAIIVYGIAGFLYSLLDNYFRKRATHTA